MAKHRRSVVGAGLALSLPAVLAGCSAYEPIDAETIVQRQLEQLVPADLLAKMELPYEVAPAMLEDLGNRVNPAWSETRRTEALVEYIFERLDLQYSLVPTRSAQETFYDRQGNCLSFVNLFVGLGRAKRLNPFYVEVQDYQRWNYQNGVVVSRGHIVAGMYVDGELSTFDFLPYRPKSYRDFRPIEDVLAVAHYYNNLGAEALMTGSMEDAETHLRIATALAPDFDKALNNLGVLLLRKGQVAEAIEVYENGLQLHPTSVPLLGNLARSYQQAGRQQEAQALFERLDAVNEGNPFYYVYRGEMSLGEGDTRRALDYMRRGWEIDNRLPEVHIGLSKVYLALGRFDEARHHVRRALRLDATNSEALEYARLLEERSIAKN